jgi:acetyl esterase/lipase
VTSSLDDATVPLTDSVLGGVECRVLRGGEDVTILYLHGGGYRMGSTEAYAPHGARLARCALATVVLVEYRLAPEAPFPAAVRDAISVYHALRATHPTRPLAVAGDSAGAGLAASVVLAARLTGVPRPDRLAVLSPWLDLTCTSPHYQSATDPLFGHDTALKARDSYLQGHDPKDPLVSALYADLTGFPPTLIQVGTTESLLGDACGFADGLAAAGVSCQLEIVAGRGHTWPLVDPDHPDSTATIESFRRFVEGSITRGR